MPGRDDCEFVSATCPVSDTVYGYAPNLGGTAFYTLVFAVCAISQFFYICKYWRLWRGFSILVFIGCTGECLGYIGRLFLHKNPWNGAALTLQLLLLMVSPSFLAAALYMTLRTTVQHFGQENTKLPARLWTWPFVTADLIGFVAQCGGGIIASMAEKHPTLGKVGNGIMIAGVAFQAVVMAVAGALAVDYVIRMRKRQGAGVFKALSKNLKIFLSCMTVAYVLILARCIYRIPELAGGVGGPLMRKEAEFMIFDGCLILLSCALFCTAHPGIFAGETRQELSKQPSPSQGYDAEKAMGLEKDYPQGIDRHSRWANRA